MHPNLEKLATLLEEAEQKNDFERILAEHLALDNAPVEILERWKAIREVRRQIEELAKSQATDTEADQETHDEAGDGVVYDPVARELIDTLKSRRKAIEEGRHLPIKREEYDHIFELIEIASKLPDDPHIQPDVSHVPAANWAIFDLVETIGEGRLHRLRMMVKESPHVFGGSFLENLVKIESICMLIDKGGAPCPGYGAPTHVIMGLQSICPDIDLTPLLRESFHELIRQGRWDEACKLQLLAKDEIINESIAGLDEKARESLALAHFRDIPDVMLLHPLSRQERGSSSKLEEMESFMEYAKQYCDETESQPDISDCLFWRDTILRIIRGSLDVAPTTS